MKEEKENSKVVLDLTELNIVLNKYPKDIEKIEVYRNNASVKIENMPENTNLYDL